MPHTATAGPTRRRAACGRELCWGTSAHRLRRRCAKTQGKPVQPSVLTASATPIMGWSMYWFLARGMVSSKIHRIRYNQKQQDTHLHYFPTFEALTNQVEQALLKLAN